MLNVKFLSLVWILNHPSKAVHGCNLVGNTGDVSHPLFQTGGHNVPCLPTFLSLGFVFGEVSKLKMMFVTFCFHVRW